jgi:hypothetical protein
MRNRDEVFAEAWQAIIGIAQYNMRYTDTLPMADMHNLLRIKDVKVFEICDSDAVAARTLEEAIAWYTDHTGIGLEELHEEKDIREVERDYMVWDDETRNRKISVEQILLDYWQDEPFIVYSDNY